MQAACRSAGALAAGRTPPSFIATWRDLVRLGRTQRLTPELASPFAPLWPLVALAATVLAACLLPGFALGLPMTPLGDLPTVIGLLALGRVAHLLAGLESGEGGRGRAATLAGRDVAVAEASLFVIALAVAGLAGTTGLEAIARAVGPSGGAAIATRVLGAIALVLALRAERVDRALFEDEAGPVRASWMLEAMLRRVVLSLLAIDLFLPVGLASGAAPLSWVPGLVVLAAKLGAVVVVIAAADAALPCQAGRGVTLAPLVAGLALLVEACRDVPVALIVLAVGVAAVFASFGLLLARRLSPRDAVRLSLGGMVVIAGALGVWEAALLGLLGLAGERLAMLLAPEDRWIALASGAVLACLPPFAPFAAVFATVRETALLSPVLAAVIGVVLAATMAVGFVRMVRAPVSPGTSLRWAPGLGSVLAALVLLGLVALGVAPDLLAGLV